MRVAIEAGAEIDIPSTKEIHAIMRKALSEDASVVKKLRAQVVMPSSGIGVADLGTPPAGRAWDLRSIWVSGNDPSATVASAKALVGIGAPPVTGAAVATIADPTLFYILFASVPNATTFSKDEATVIGQEHLFVVFVGAANTTQLNVGAQVVMATQAREERFEW